MFEGFSDEARVVIDAAQEQAHELGHHAVSTAHLLLGLLVEEAHRLQGGTDAIGSSPFRAAGVVLEDVLAGVATRADDSELAATRPHDRWRSGNHGRAQLPLTAKTKKALELSLRRALQLGDEAQGAGRRQLITPAHMVLGTLDQPEAHAREILLACGVDLAYLTRVVEQAAAAAPSIGTHPRPEKHEQPIAADEPAADDDGTIYAVFGLPEHLSLTGPAARRVLAEWKQSGHLDDAKLAAAAEADAADSHPTGEPNDQA